MFWPDSIPRSKSYQADRKTTPLGQRANRRLSNVMSQVICMLTYNSCLHIVMFSYMSTPIHTCTSHLCFQTLALQCTYKHLHTYMYRHEHFSVYLTSRHCSADMSISMYACTSRLCFADMGTPVSVY
jgi:hypothetical protein